MSRTLFIAASAYWIASSNAMPPYRENFPNGLLFPQQLGHIGTSTTNSEFGLLYAANRDWSKLCKLKFPGTQMTNGEAFGDPCCEWKKGAAAPQTITVWADKPTVATVCKTSGGGAGGSTAATPSAGAATPAAGATVATPASGATAATPAADATAATPVVKAAGSTPTKSGTPSNKAGDNASVVAPAPVAPPKGGTDSTKASCVTTS